MSSSWGKNKIHLGFDTSNYRTSVAAVDEQGEVLANVRKLLSVDLGSRGLRQSEALFQHVNNLPGLVHELFQIIGDLRDDIASVSVSTRPRPVEGSYMPVFNAGRSAASMLADSRGVPLYTWSHQEGHIQAVRQGSSMEEQNRFISFHFSGGTTEAILVEEHPDAETTYEIVGGSRDISYGQLLDRIGVALGMEFPSGEEMDRIALSTEPADIKLPLIKVKDGYINLSGLETHCQRALETTDGNQLIEALFREIARSIRKMMEQLSKKYQVEDFLFAGGVSSSQFIRERIQGRYRICFGDPALSSDNAVGIAQLGRKRYGIEAHKRITTE